MGYKRQVQRVLAHPLKGSLLDVGGKHVPLY